MLFLITFNPIINGKELKYSTETYLVKADNLENATKKIFNQKVTHYDSVNILEIQSVDDLDFKDDIAFLFGE
jgi:hypothetical protein